MTNENKKYWAEVYSRKWEQNFSGYFSGGLVQIDLTKPDTGSAILGKVRVYVQDGCLCIEVPNAPLVKVIKGEEEGVFV